MFTSTQPLLLIILTVFYSFHTCHSKIQASGSSSSSGIDGDDFVPTFTLANGIKIPLVGLGSASGVTYTHVKTAIAGGYRYIDTAQSSSWGYREGDVGRAVHESKLRYEDQSGKGGDYVFVQTKIHPQDLGYHSTQEAIALSLDRLKVSSLDSILIHKPRCWEGICSHEPEGTWEDSWVALEEAVDAGTVRAIGICDVDHRLLEQLLQKRIGPMIIQNWFDPFHQDKAFRRRIEQHNKQNPDRKILYQGYSSLGTQWHHFKGYSENPVLNHPMLKAIAEQHGATVPQVVIQWGTRSGVMILPASRNPEHQKSNLNSFFFTLSDEEMRSIDGLDGNPPPKPGPKQRDPNEVKLQFVNKADGPMQVYWVPDGSKTSNESDHVHVGEMKGLGDVLSLTSYHGHAFLFKEGTNKMLNRHVVDKSLGSEQNHEIDDRSEEL